MKCLIFSDSHGCVSYIVKALKLHPDAEVVFFLGDGLSDIEYLRSSYKTVAFLSVRGNCDSRASLFGNSVEKLESVTLMDKRIVYTHGDLYGVKYGDGGLIRLAKERSADVILYGHTHIPRESYIPTEEGGFYLFNPGSIGYSYGSSPTYGIMDLGEKGIAFSHGSFV